MLSDILSVLSSALVAVAILLAAVGLSSCARYEGAGFSNSGAYKEPARAERRGNVEYWSNRQ